MRIIQSQSLEQWFRGSVVVGRDGNPMPLYHASEAVGLRAFKIPFFCSDDKGSVDWYGETIYTVHLRMLKPLDARVRYDSGKPDVLLVARAAGIEFHGGTATEEFSCPAIAEHSDNEGHNANDMFYIPAFRQELKRQGYDGLIVRDIMTNYEINVWLPLRPDQIWLVGEHRVGDDDQD
jgi:hypothetical protein